MSVDHLNGHHETFIGQFIKWTISGELPISLKSHQDSYFWSTRPLFSVGYYERPCMYVEKERFQYSMDGEPDLDDIHVESSLCLKV